VNGLRHGRRRGQESLRLVQFVDHVGAKPVEYHSDGTGKTILAREKARRLAAEGFRTLLVCFNQPLARTLADDLAGAPAPGGLDVLTFHELCLRMGREAGTLPVPEPAEKIQDWWDVVLPHALDAAIPEVGGR